MNQPSPAIRQEVARAAAYFYTTERELFRRAFEASFARPPDATELERAYLSFARGGQAPTWFWEYLSAAYERQVPPGVTRRLADRFDSVADWLALVRLLWRLPRARMPHTDLVA
ncbi:MAG: hypothetical protein K0U93_11570 [Gammaproteobacteria bacterium]|nr:hypothetical protein [Gammaproteobacteria bacterium]